MQIYHTLSSWKMKYLFLLFQVQWLKIKMHLGSNPSDASTSKQATLISMVIVFTTSINTFTHMSKYKHMQIRKNMSFSFWHFSHALNNSLIRKQYIVPLGSQIMVNLCSAFLQTSQITSAILIILTISGRYAGQEVLKSSCVAYIDQAIRGVWISNTHLMAMSQWPWEIALHGTIPNVCISSGQC